jgi:hypothetical protein
MCEHLGIKQLIKEKNELLRQWQNNNNNKKKQLTYEQYKIKRNIVTNQIKKK